MSLFPDRDAALALTSIEAVRVYMAWAMTLGLPSSHRWASPTCASSQPFLQKLSLKMS